MRTATRVFATTIGVICGISGLEHGFFETLQGNVIPEIHMISGRPMVYAIGEANRFWQYGYEYAFTVIPNFLVTGILAMLVSLFVIIWSAGFIQKKYGWLVFIFLSIFQYLVGGGAAQLGPAIIVGLVASRINKPVKFWQSFIPIKVRQFLAKQWFWLLVVFALVFCQSIVTAVFGFFFGVNDPDLINHIMWGMLYFMIVMLALVVVSVLAHDSMEIQFKQDTGKNHHGYPNYRAQMEQKMKYRSVVVTKQGSPEVLQVVENDLRLPRPKEARIKILAAPVCAPDVTARYGRSPFVPKVPFLPGYAVVGNVDAVGRNVSEVNVGERVAALTAYGAYAEFLYWAADELIPVPANLDPAEVAPIILNYIVAYHVMHRWAKVKAGDRVLIIGASGGIGTAFLQLGKLAGLKMYGVASKSKHHILEEYGATPIDYHTQDFVEVIRQLEPDGLDAVFDGMAGDSFKRGFSVLGRGGTLVGYGNPLSMGAMFQVLGQVALFSLLPNGKSAKYYSTGVSRINRSIFLEDWAILFKMLEEGQIKPVIEAKFPILEARRANELLESGQVVGNIVLVAPEFYR